MTNISNKDELRRLIARYVKGKASQEEKTFLRRYYEHFDDRNDGLDVLTEKQKARLKAQMLNKIQHKLHPHRQTNVIRIARIAAAIMVLIATAVGLWYIGHSAVDIDDVVVQDQQNLFVVDSAISHEKHLYLPDGSYVVLEPGGQLKYLRNFNSSVRKVELNGQAFFDVQHDVDHPFVVECSGVRTKVLGTAFTISSYDDSQEFSISVARGKVEVSDKAHKLEVLEKDDQLILDRDTREYTKNRLDTGELAKLEPEHYIMDDITVAKAIHIMEKRWNCEFVIENPALKNCRFTTSFLPTDNLDVVVAVMATVTGAEYNINNKVVFLRGDGCKE